MRLGPPRQPTRVVDLINPAAVLAPPPTSSCSCRPPASATACWRARWTAATSTSTRSNGPAPPAPTSRRPPSGTDADRALIRGEVDTAHAPVRSTAVKPVSYNAFDPALQLWVAACLYRYYIDQHEFLYGPLDDESADAIYRDAGKLGTTLQVREDMWPADRVAFDEFWKRSLDELNIDQPVREHLHGVAAMAFLPAPLRSLAGRFNLFATKGFLPAEFRAMMRMPWSATQQRQFDGC